MPKIDPRCRTLDVYPARCEISARISDMDGYRHLNSIRIGLYYEEARATLYRAALAGLPKMRMPVVEMTLRYLDEGFWPGTLQVGTGIAHIGNSSFRTFQGLFQDSRCLGFCQTTIVNAVEGRATRLSEDARRALEQMCFDPSLAATL